MKSAAGSKLATREPPEISIQTSTTHDRNGFVMYITMAAIGILGLLALIISAPEPPTYDEPWHLETVNQLDRLGLSTTFLRELPGPSGPTFTLVHYAFRPLTQLQTPGVRLVSFGLLLLCLTFAALTIRLLHECSSLSAKRPYLKTSGLQGAFDNLLGSADSISVDFDLPESFDFGLRYRATDNLTLLADSNYQRWSQFSQTNVKIDVGPTGDAVVTGFDRDWKDTWHVGGAFKYDLGGNHLMGMGVSYDSSPVTNKDRTADLPLDEQFRVAAAYGKNNPIGLSYDFSAFWVYFGEGKMDQTAQGERFKGEFDTNYLVFVAASVHYRF